MKESNKSTKPLKRLLFVIGLPICVIYSAIKWIITGGEFGKPLDKFEDWCGVY